MVAAAVAGIIGPVAFAAVVVIHAAIRPDYSHVTSVVSALAAGPTGWIQNANFIGFGLLLILYAVGLHRGVRPPGMFGPTLLAASGLALMGAGFFPATDASGAFQSEGVPAHTITSVLTFLTSGIGLIVLSRRMSLDPNWSSHARFALLIGITVLALLVAFATLAGAPTSLLFPWQGLVQRVLIIVWLASTFMLSLQLSRVARRDQNGSQA